MNKYKYYIKGVENYLYMYNSFNRKRNIKELAYYLATLIFSKRQDLNWREVVLSDGVQQEKYWNKVGKKHRVHRGITESSLLQALRTTNFSTVIKRTDRVKALFMAGTLSRETHTPYSFALEYVLIWNSLRQICPERVVVNGHYDKVTTWLSALASEFNYDVEMFQHGLVVYEYDLPHKHLCKIANVYDEYSADVFKKCIVSNPDCTYNIVGFVSLVDFKNTDFSGTKVGIVDQGNPEWIRRVIGEIDQSNLSNKHYFIFPHPLYKHNYEKLFSNDDRVSVERGERIINLDYLVMDYSTIYKDYLANDYKGIIISFSDERRNDLPLDIRFADYSKSGELAELINCVECKAL